MFIKRQTFDCIQWVAVRLSLKSIVYSTQRKTKPQNRTWISARAFWHFHLLCCQHCGSLLMLTPCLLFVLCLKQKIGKIHVDALYFIYFLDWCTFALWLTGRTCHRICRIPSCCLRFSSLLLSVSGTTH